MPTEKPETDNWVPRPDPTILTTQALAREIASLRETLTLETSCIKESLVARLNGMDDRFVQLHAEFDRQPALTIKQVEHLEMLHEEKFRSIQVQFIERDTRTDQTSRDSKVAVDAALQAAKEAVAEQNRSSALSITKSEAATGKQIDQLVALMQSNMKATDDKFDDVKERLTRIEGKGEGVAVTRTSHQSMNSFVLAIIGMIMGTLVGIAGLVLAFWKH